MPVGVIPFASHVTLFAVINIHYSQKQTRYTDIIPDIFLVPRLLCFPRISFYVSEI